MGGGGPKPRLDIEDFGINKSLVIKRRLAIFRVVGVCWQTARFVYGMAPGGMV